MVPSERRERRVLRVSQSAEIRRLAVLGSPIGHSKSPALHRAAYEVLGLPWQYEAVEVREGELATQLGELDSTWRGLSLTMPLKREVLPLLDELDELAAQSQLANTVLIDGGRRRGFNTDVGGIVAALAEAGIEAPQRVLVLGSGATATSAIFAARELGADAVLAARSPEKAHGPAERHGLGEAAELIATADVVISTIPAGAGHDIRLPALDAHQALLDAVYDPWPTPLVAAWRQAGGAVIDGLAMLLHQAVLQERIFVNGDPALPLEREAEVAEAMRRAVERS